MAESVNTALVMREEDRLSVFDPRWMEAAAQLTDRLAKSSLVREDLRGKSADIFLILMKGYELGIQPTQALTELYVIKGKVGMSASLIVGLCVKHPNVCRYFSLTESNERIATYETLRAGAPKPVSLSYTIEEAARAGLVQGANWTRFRAAMLRARAATALARVVYPDLCSGLYSPEELKEGSMDTSLEVATPRAEESLKTVNPSGPGLQHGTTPAVGKGSIAVPDSHLELHAPESDQPPSDSPPDGLEEPDSLPSVQPPPAPPSGRLFNQAEFLQRVISVKNYPERLKLTKELYDALYRGEITELEASALRRKVQEKRL